MSRILVVDGHPLFRQGIIQALAHEIESPFFGEAGSAAELHEALAYPWDLIILDLVLPGYTGLDLLGTVKQARPEQPVLVLSMYSEAQCARLALQRGANGYLSKTITPHEFALAVRQIISGQNYASPCLAELLVSNLVARPKPLLHELLSPREYQVMLGLVLANTPADIARDLSLSIKTVSTFRMRVLRKMGMQTNADLALYAHEHSLLPEAMARGEGSLCTNAA